MIDLLTNPLTYLFGFWACYFYVFFKFGPAPIPKNKVNEPYTDG